MVGGVLPCGDIVTLGIRDGKLAIHRSMPNRAKGVVSIV